MTKNRARGLAKNNEKIEAANALFPATVVCMYVCMHVCMHAWMHVCMYAWMYVCMYVCMHACMHACMHVLYVCMESKKKQDEAHEPECSHVC